MFMVHSAWRRWISYLIDRVTSSSATSRRFGRTSAPRHQFPALGTRSCPFVARRLPQGLDVRRRYVRWRTDTPCVSNHRREGSTGPVTLEEARRRLRELKASWDYAFAMGHGCSIGPDPRFEPVRREVADLAAIIAEHTPPTP